MNMKQAEERCAYIMEQARLNEEALEAAGTRVAPTAKELAMEAERNARRKQARDHWVNIILPRIRTGTLPQEFRRGYY